MGERYAVAVYRGPHRLGLQRGRNGRVREFPSEEAAYDYATELENFSSKRLAIVVVRLEGKRWLRLDRRRRSALEE